MQNGSQAFATVVTSSGQTIAYQIIIGFPSNLISNSAWVDVTSCVSDFQITRAMTTVLPDGTTQLSGFPTASANVTLTGPLNQGIGNLPNPVQTIYWLMNPYNSASPMYRTTRAGLPVTILAGFYDGSNAPELITVFTGSIDTCACSYGVVKLTCRDNRSMVTNQAQLPPVITFAPFNAGLTSEFAIDYLLRHASPGQYYSWPAQRPNCLLAVGFRSSIWADVGSYAFYAQNPVFVPGEFGTALGTTASLIVYSLVGSLATTDKNNVQLLSSGNFEININDTAVQYGLIIERLGNTVYVFGFSPSGTFAATSFTVSSGYHLIEYSASWPAGSATITGSIWIDGTQHTFTNTAADTRPGGNTFTVAAIGGGPIEGVQITNESTFTPLGSFTPTLIIDPAGSLNALSALPDVTGQDTWSVLQNIASAEFAVIGLDELGIMHFINRNTIIESASVRIITSTQSLISLDTQEQMSMVATHIQIPESLLMIQPYATVWAASTAIEVGASSTFQTVVTTDNPVLALGTTIVIWSGVAVAGTSGYRAARNQDGSGGAISNLQITLTQLSASAINVSIKNPNSYAAWLVSPANSGFPSTSNGNPALLIGGQAVTSSGTVTDTTTTTNGGSYADAQWPPANADGSGGAIDNQQFGEILLQLPANDWVQDPTSAQELAVDLLSDYYQPRPLYTNVSIIADPRLQLADRVTMQDLSVSGISADALLLGITLKVGQGSWSQDISALAIYGPGDWILGDAVYSILGVTTYT